MAWARADFPAVEAFRAGSGPIWKCRAAADPARVPSGRPVKACRCGRGSAGGQDHAASASAEGRQDGTAQAGRGCAPGSVHSARPMDKPLRRRGSPGNDPDAQWCLPRGPIVRLPPAGPWQCARAATPPRAFPNDRSGSAAGTGRTLRIGRQAPETRYLLAFGSCRASFDAIIRGSLRGPETGSPSCVSRGVPIFSRAFRRIQAHFRAPKVQL